MDEEQNLGGEMEAPQSEEMELNPSNAFGELLLDLIEIQFADQIVNPEDTSPAISAGIQALVQATGLSEEEITSIISGESIVDDPDVLEAIVAAFPDANEEDINTIIEVASGVEEEDRNALSQQYDTEEGEGQPEEMTPEQQGADYAIALNPAMQANFNRNVVAELERIKQEKAQLEAHFAKEQFTSQLSAQLSDLDARLTQDVADGTICPAIKEALIGNFSNPAQRVAQFSGISETNGARDLAEQLYASEFAYSLLKNVANVVQFTDFSISADEAATANFSATLEKAAEGDLEAMGLDLSIYGL